VVGTTVPKASIDKYGEPADGKNEIGVAENPRSPPPTYQMIFSERTNKPDLGRKIASAFHARHNLRSFPAGENVNHAFISVIAHRQSSPCFSPSSGSAFKLGR
jgi:hypothetical protein